MKMKKKVCILQNGLARGGTDTFVVNLCRFLDKDKFDITVVNPSSRPESRVREPEVLAAGVKLLRTHDLGRGWLGKCRHFLRLYRILKEGRFDIFQTNIDLFNGPNLLVAWLAGVPLRCCHSHNSMQLKAVVRGMSLPVRLYQAVMRWMCWHFSNRRCGCSSEAMEFLYAGRDWQNSSYPAIIANGIDLQKYQAPVDVEQKKQALELKPVKHFVTVGRIGAQKNPIFIAESFSALCKLRGDCDLIWVGVGPLEEECRSILQRHGVTERVHFLGSRDDVSEILACADVFYLPSVFEGLGIVLIEAQAAGLPCLISDTIPDAANCGLCHKVSLSQTAEEWAHAMSEMLDGRIPLRLDETKMRFYSAEHMAEQMAEVFES